MTVPGRALGLVEVRALEVSREAHHQLVTSIATAAGAEAALDLPLVAEGALAAPAGARAATAAEVTPDHPAQAQAPRRAQRCVCKIDEPTIMLLTPIQLIDCGREIDPECDREPPSRDLWRLRRDRVPGPAIESSLYVLAWPPHYIPLLKFLNPDPFAH